MNLSWFLAPYFNEKIKEKQQEMPTWQVGGKGVKKIIIKASKVIITKYTAELWTLVGKKSNQKIVCF